MSPPRRRGTGMAPGSAVLTGSPVRVHRRREPPPTVLPVWALPPETAQAGEARDRGGWRRQGLLGRFQPPALRAAAEAPSWPPPLLRRAPRALPAAGAAPASH